MIKAITEGYFQTVNEDNFTSCIRDQGSEQDENKADKCRQHFTTGFRKLCKSGLVVLHSSEKLWPVVQ